MGYATIADFETFSGRDSEPGIERRLERASELLDTSLITAVYATDTNGAPTDTIVIDALKRACCAQVQWELETDDEFGRAGNQAASNIGASGSWESVAIGPVASVRRSPARGVGTDRLAPKASEILRVAKLLSVRPLAF